MTITEVLEKLLARVSTAHYSAVRAASMALLIPLGVEGVASRASIQSSGEGREVVDELVVDGCVVWRGGYERNGWVCSWLVKPDDLRRR